MRRQEGSGAILIIDITDAQEIIAKNFGARLHALCEIAFGLRGQIGSGYPDGAINFRYPTIIWIIRILTVCIIARRDHDSLPLSGAGNLWAGGHSFPEKEKNQTPADIAGINSS